MLIPVWPELLFAIFILLLVFFIPVLRTDYFNKKNFLNIKNNISQIILLLAFLCVLIFLAASFIAPNFLTVYPLDKEPSANTATTINGLMSPFIAIAAAILTFMAFWVQYNANQNIHTENKQQQAERQFYEMLKIHKRNVNELQFKLFNPKSYTKQTEPFDNMDVLERKGREIFHFYHVELDFLYKYVCIVDAIPQEPSSKQIKETLTIAYNIFYKRMYRSRAEEWLLNGIGNAIFESTTETNFRGQLRLLFQASGYMYPVRGLLLGLFCRLWRYKLFFGNQKPFTGHFPMLNHYYRHLYLTVKLIANGSDLSYSEKRNLLRILRAQLTNEEQLMLFYNWFSGNGRQWEAMKDDVQKNNAVQNNFFSRYRMIHNIIPSDVVFCSSDNLEKNAKKFIQLFKDTCVAENLPPQMCLKKEYDYENEVIFEFEDWFEKGTLGFTYPEKK